MLQEYFGGLLRWNHFKLPTLRKKNQFNLKENRHILRNKSDRKHLKTYLIPSGSVSRFLKIKCLFIKIFPFKVVYFLCQTEYIDICAKVFWMLE